MPLPVFQPAKTYLLAGQTGKAIEDEILRTTAFAGTGLREIQTPNGKIFSVVFPEYSLPDGASTKKAILQIGPREFVELHCMESSEVLFFDFVAVRLKATADGRLSGRRRVAKELLATCERGSVRPAGQPLAQDSPAVLAARVDRGRLLVWGHAWPDQPAPTEAIVRVVGVRLGFAGVKWRRTTEKAARRNNALWAQAD